MMPSLRNALLCVLFLLAPPALADDGFGTIMGTVLNGEDRGTLSDVVVTATSPSLMGEQNAITGEDGFYWFPQLPPGIYRLRFESEQFRPDIRDVVVRLNQTYRMNVDLLPEGLGECFLIAGGSSSVPWGARPSRRNRAGSQGASSSYTPPRPPSP
jgi:Ca-activated chloride channel family protein